jgi:hypothetical protein
MSEIDFAAIDATYPTAGQDNNTQGFRDNFSAIKNGLEVAKAEITGLTTVAVKVGIDGNSSPIINDLLHAIIKNGKYSDLSGIVHTEIVSSTADIDVRNGPFQVFKASTDTTLRFTNWPAATLPSGGAYAVIRVHIHSDASAARNVTLTTENAGILKFEYPFNRDFAVNITNTKHKVIEAWSYDHGTTVYVKYLGEFDASVSL